MAEKERAETKSYSVGLTWSGDAKGCGEILAGGGTVKIPIGGSVDLGGCGIGANPEELLLGAVGACFINTWAIFLKKLAVGYAEPSIRVDGILANDPAGGFRMTSATIHARVPGSLLAEKKDAVARTLQLAEKYCIISKAVRGSMPINVELEEV